MTLALANPLGWAFGEILTSSQQNALQNEVIKALDGVNGGSYTLATALTLLGAGLSLGGVNHQVTGTLSVVNTALLTLLSGGTLTAAAGSTTNLQGTTNVSGTTTVSGPTTVSDPVTLSGDGHVRKRVLSHIADADLSIGVNTCDVMWIEGSGTSGMTSDHALTLLSTGAAAGSQILIFTDHSTYAMTNADTGNLKAASGFVKWALMTYGGGAWQRSAYYIVP